MYVSRDVYKGYFQLLDATTAKRSFIRCIASFGELDAAAAFTIAIATSSIFPLYLRSPKIQRMVQASAT